MKLALFSLLLIILQSYTCDWNDDVFIYPITNSTIGAESFPQVLKVCSKRIFFTPRFTYQKSQLFCIKNGGRLIDIQGTFEFKCLAWFLRLVGKSPSWIRSFNGDSYDSIGVALYAASDFGIGAIAKPQSLINHGICEQRI